MKERPLLLLDVDGVLNPYAATACPEGFEEHRLFPDAAELVRVSRAHSRWLLRLRGRYELAWVSSWGSEANRLLAPLLGLPDLPFVPLPDPPFLPAMKVPAVAAFAHARRLAWLDDELTDEAHRWAAARGPDKTLLISVDPTVGLTLEMTEELDRFAKADDSG